MALPDAQHGIAVVVLKARDAVSDRRRGLDAGAQDSPRKPLASESLFARVRSLTRRIDRPAAVLSCADVSLDSESQRATRAGERLDLAAKEFAPVALSLRHPDATLGRARIPEQVWGKECDGLSNALAVRVGELRRKLEARGPRRQHNAARRRLRPPRPGRRMALTNRRSRSAC